MKLGWNRHFRATETFGADSDDVSVWEHAVLPLPGRFEICTAIHTNVVQSRTVTLSAVAVKEFSRSVKIFNSKLREITISRIHMEDGVRQRVASIVRDRVRQTVARVPRNARRASRSKRDRTAWNATYMGGHVERPEYDLNEG